MERTFGCVSSAHGLVGEGDAAGDHATELVCTWVCAGGHHRICMVADRKEEQLSGAIPCAT